MAQQFHNGGQHKGSVTIQYRDSIEYAVINPPFEGKHCKGKPGEGDYLEMCRKRKLHWEFRNSAEERRIAREGRLKRKGKKA